MKASKEFKKENGDKYDVSVSLSASYSYKNYFGIYVQTIVLKVKERNVDLHVRMIINIGNQIWMKERNTTRNLFYLISQQNGLRRFKWK